MRPAGIPSLTRNAAAKAASMSALMAMGAMGALIALLALPGRAHAAPGISPGISPEILPGNTSKAATVHSLAVGKAKVIRLSRPASEVLVSDPAVADISLPGKQRLYLLGREIGDANVFVFDRAGEVIEELDLHVRIEPGALERTLAEILPGQNLRIRAVGSDLVMSGRLTTPAKAEMARRLARRFLGDAGDLVDLTTIEGQAQVMLQVRVVEAEKRSLRELGLEPEFGPDPFDGGDGSVSFSSDSSIGLAEVPFSTGSLFYQPGDFGPLSVAIQALEEDGAARILAEPNLTALSGETAEFLSGGEFPIPVGEDDGDISIEFRSFGVGLAFTPTVLDGERISLRLATEVSSISDQLSVVLQTTQVPGLDVRRAETTVEMRSGGTLMIAGLIQSERSNDESGAPGVKDVPGLGRLFKNSAESAVETELVVMVTPLLVEPMAVAQAPRRKSPALPVEPSDLGLSRALRERYGGDLPEDAAGAGTGYLID